MAEQDQNAATPASANPSHQTLNMDEYTDRDNQTDFSLDARARSQRAPRTQVRQRSYIPPAGEDDTRCIDYGSLGKGIF